MRCRPELACFLGPDWMLDSDLEVTTIEPLRYKDFDGF
jgi:hypothetical protein